MSRRTELAVFVGEAPRAPRRVTPEGAILREIRDALEHLGVPTWRLGVGSFRDGDRFVRLGTPGVADLLALPPGRGAVLIEVKSARGRLSREQVIFRDACRRAGAVHVVARSLDDVLPFVVPRPRR